MTTRRTHPPSLRTLAQRFFTEVLGPETEGARILVATSGGADSVALLHVLSRLRGPLRLTLGAHGVDHGLRASAAAELDGAAAVAEACDVPFTRERVSVATGSNLQARAREARWESLERAARVGGYAFVATAHHADDRAETVLLRILRGSGARGLAVLPPRSGLRIRPLYRARRDELRGYASRHGLTFADDPSNQESRFLRVRVRHEVLPLLRELDPAIVDHLTALADELETPASPSLRLPRATESALTALIRGESTPNAEVLLPGGLVVAARGTNRKRK